MPETVDPLKIQNIVKLGFERMDRFCKARALFFKSYIGQYYREERGLEGEEPLNLVFNTIRSYVPNLVGQSPTTLVTTPYVEHKQYAELLGMGLDTTARQIKLKQTLRAWVTNALFAWGITRTGLKASGELLQIDDVYIDNGQVYTRCVMLDNFGFDPTCTNIDEARCLFDMVTVPRQWLLDTAGMDHDLIVGLPTTGSNNTTPLADLTRSREAKDAMGRLQDEVDIVQMYVPETQQIVLMGDPRQKISDRFLRIADFNGPKEGPYTFLSYSPPVEGNPFPVAPVSVWYDLARSANRIFNKTLEQIEQQKDVGLFNPAMADEVNDIKEAQTGDWIPTTDPKGVNIVSYGGQNPKNDAALNSIFMWYNMMAGNPAQMQGSVLGFGGGETATKTMALQSNMTVGIDDMQDITYDATSIIMQKMAWYLFTDPFIQLPMTKRTTGGQEVQLLLTPEQRMGDFIDYVFTIKSRSMTKMDPMVRSKKILEFCTNIIPSGATTAQTFMMIGQPFNIMKYYTQMALEMGIGDWVEELFVDPEFQNKLRVMLTLGPQNPGKAKSPNTQAGVQQNGGAPMNRPVMNPAQEMNQAPQTVAAIGQSVNQGVV